MGIRKLSAHELANLAPQHKELSAFWKSYFSSLSANLTKLFFQHIREHVNVQFVHRDVVKVNDYFDHMDGDSIVHTFKIYPQGELGFLHLNEDLSNYILNSMLGGGAVETKVHHVNTSTDLVLLGNFLTGMMEVLLTQFKVENRVVEFEVIEEDAALIQVNSLHIDKLMSIQQFSIMTPTNTFVFDIAFSSRVLDSFLLV
jgi:flagellar motor switch protein FliM